MASSAYIHIPFCKSICSYCDFCKMLYDNNWVNDYLKALYKEIKDAYQNEALETIYIGGGTPSSLKPNQLEVLFKILDMLNRAIDCEVTFECNINDITPQILNVLTRHKVNRLSIGIESFNEKKLKFMQRVNNYKDCAKKIQLCRQYKFDNISCDLIYGIPEESLKDLKQDVKKLLKLKPDHISTYSLIIENHTIVGNNETRAIDEDLEFDMYDYIVDSLDVKGYNQYEISNFAKKGKRSRHNLKYWNNEEYYGFGLGASGFIDNIRYDNTKNLFKYIKGDYHSNREILSKKNDMDNEIMLGLRKIEGINVSLFNKKFGVDIYNEYPIQELLNNKDLFLKKGYIFINPDKLYIMNEILLKLV